LIDNPEVHMLQNAGHEGISTDPEAICTGQNSGYQAVNIAVLAGARRIVLVGYDAKQGKDGRKHFFGDHPDKTSAPYSQMLMYFKRAAPILRGMGVEVFNATIDTALDCFPRVPLLEAVRA
jgi:hypothetical protein